jgi:type VI protein secretion system component Hcp
MIETREGNRSIRKLEGGSMLRSRSIGRSIFLGIAVGLLSAAQAIASTPATMMIESAPPATQGSKGSKGNKPSKGGVPENLIELLSVSRSGSGAASGAASGSAKKTSAGASIVVTKAYDASSAQLEQAEATNEFLHQVTIMFSPSTAGAPPAIGNGKGSVAGSSAKKSKSGQAIAAEPATPATKIAQVLVLRNAQITFIEQTRNIQQITITYQAIDVTYTSGKTAAATDDWETQ